jgi:hypothetical protein
MMINRFKSNDKAANRIVCRLLNQKTGRINLGEALRVESSNKLKHKIKKNE